MGFIGNLAEAILITWIAFYILAMFSFAAQGRMEMLLLFLAGLLIPLSMIVYDYWKHKTKLTSDHSIHETRLAKSTPKHSSSKGCLNKV
jgi:hypothetical protein